MTEISHKTSENSGLPTSPGVKNPPVPDRFELLKLLWVDNLLWVYEVRDHQTGQSARLWLEQITDNLAEHNSRSQALLNLTHPNLWAIYDRFISSRAGVRFCGIVTNAPDEEYIPLRTLIAGSITPLVAGQIFRQLALVLEYCHSRRVVHCHLQPAFIWVSPKGIVRLEMFAALPRLPGLSKPAHIEKTAPGFLGTAYASPEQFIKTSRPDPRLDIYALGIITYEMLAGFNPFLANSELASLVRRLHKKVAPLHQVNPLSGAGLEEAIATALVKNPDARYRTILDFLSRFEIGLDSDFQTADPPQPFQTIAQLLEQAKSMAEAAYNFPNLKQPTAAPAEIISTIPTTVQNEPVKTAPGEASKTAPTPTPPVRKAAASARPFNKPVKRTPFVQSPSFIPALLALNLFLMGFLAWLLLNSPGPAGPATNAPQTFEPGQSYVYPTIDSAEQTLIAGQLAPTFSFQSRLAGSPAPSNPVLTLNPATGGPVALAPTNRPLTDNNPEPTPTPTSPQTVEEAGSPTGLVATLPGQVEITQTNTPAIVSVDAKSVTLDFSPPDNFPASETTPGANRLAEADRTFFVNGKAEEAIEVYQAALGQNSPEGDMVYRKLGRLLYLWDHPTYRTGAIDTLQKAVDINRNDALAWAYLAFAYFDRYDYAKGTDAANQAIALAPDLPEALGANALALVYSGKPGLAVGEITRAAGIDAQNGNFWVYLAWFKIARTDQDLSGALTLIDDLIENYPGVAWFYCAKGEILWMQGAANIPQALNLFQKALSLDNNLFYAHSNLGWVYYLQGNNAEAKKEFDLALQNNPEDSSALAGNGYILITQKDYSNAQAALQKAVQLNSQNGVAFNGLASVYLYQGDNNKALELAKQALKFIPNYADAFFNAGQAYYKLSDFQNAVSNFQQAARLNPSNASYQEMLALAFYQLKDFPEARQAAQAGLALQPDNQVLIDLLKQIGEK